VKSLKIGNAVVCEHVVNGGPGKHTLVNAYGGDLLLPDMPTTIVVGIYLEVISHDLPTAINVEVFLGKSLIMGAEVILSGHVPGNPAILAIPMLPLEVREPCTLRIRLSADGFRPVDALKKSILAAPSPAA
jgi:hypothetical protein